MRPKQTHELISRHPLSLRQRGFDSLALRKSPLNAICLVWLLFFGVWGLNAQNPIAGNQGFQIISEGNFTFTGYTHVHGAMAVGGNLNLNCNGVLAEICMDGVSSYVFPGDGASATGLLVKGGVSWTNGGAKVMGGKYMHLGNSTGCIQSDNGVNMATQILPTGGTYNQAKRIEGGLDQTPSPSPFQAIAFDFTTLFNTYRTNSDGMAACANNVQLYNSSNAAIAGNNVGSLQNVQINSLANGVNVLNLTSASLNNLSELKFNAGALPSASKLLVINVPLTGNFTWNNCNMPGLSGSGNGAYIIWNFSGSTTYNLTINTASLVIGTIFAPNHNLIKTGTGDIDGGIIAETIVLGLGEIHLYNFNGNIPLCGTCSNVTSPGSIGAAQAGCTGGFNPNTITETAAPAGGTGTLEYQWQSSADNLTWANISGATSQTYDPPILSATTYYRRGVKRSGCSSYSYSSSIAMTVAPAITLVDQPLGALINSGGSHTMSVTASGGTPSLTYQWQSSTDNVTFNNIIGATMSTYTTPALTVTTYYRVVVSASGNGCGSQTSASVDVTVGTPTNFACNNFLVNPEFDYGTNRWGFWANTGNTASFNVSTSSQLSGANSAFIDLSTVVGGASNAWQVQFMQTGFPVYAGTSYTVSFEAKAAANRNIYVTLQQNVNPYTIYGGQTVALTTTKNTYTLTFNITTTDLNSTGLYFNLGESVADVYLDNIVWSEKCGTQLCAGGVGNNLISNSEMDFSTNNWYLNVQGGASASYSIVNTNQLSGTNSAFINIATATGTNWHVQFSQPGRTVTAGTTYRVSFKAKATANRNMYVSLQKNVSPWDEIAGQTVALTTSSTTFTLQFTSNITFNNDVGIYFHLGESNADVYIDDIEWAEICNTEICNNGLDDDGDGKIDAADSDCGSCDAPTYGFQNGTLISGTALSPGAVYLFSNVVAGTDVQVKINSFSHPDVSISSIDLSAYDAPGGYNLAFQPQVLYGWSNGGGSYDSPGERFVNFTFSFFDAGTNTPQEFSKLILSAIDVDGDNGSIMEFIETSGFASYETNSPTNLTLSGALKAKSNITNATNIDETALAHMISYIYKNKNAITVKYGADWNGTSNNFADNRLNSMYFKCYSLNTQVTCPTAAVSGKNSICSGTNQVLTVTASGGTGAPSYQWQSSSDNVTWTNISGATSTSYTTPNISTKIYYRVGISYSGNATCGMVFSDDFPVTPGVCLENCSNGVDDNGNGLIDGADLDCVTLCPTGSISFQRWLNVSGTSVSDLTGNANFPNTPNQTGTITSFDGPDNIADNYGTRVRGYITPSVTGNYIFNLTSDDAGQLFLSMNANPANKQQIASISGWTNPAEYNKYSTQTSAPYYLVAGRNYYVELLQKEGGGLDHLQVYWKTPSNSSWTIIPGANLRPFNCSEICGNTVDDDGNGLTDCQEAICQPSFITQPVGATICNGGTHTLNANATVGATYQWQSSTDNITFTNLSGATSASYTTAALTVTTYYRVVVRLNGCNLTSNVATVTVVADPSIATQPVSATVCTGGTQTLSVTAAGGTPSLSFQWQSSSNNLAFSNVTGATSSSYTTPVLTSTTYYRVIVSATGGGCGTVTSSSATVTVVPAISISTQPVGSTLCSGGTHSLSVVATGGGPSLNYQWQSSTDNVTFANISGATASNYTTPALTATTYFKVVVSSSGGGCGSVTSSAATVTVVADPTISAQPASASICMGTTKTLSVTATGGTPALTYQWQGSLDNIIFINISGATSSSYTTPSLLLTSYYRVIVSATGNGCGSATSNIATITVSACIENCSNGIDDDSDGLVDCADNNCSLSLLANAGNDATICNGTSALLSASATGGLIPYTYTWSNSLGNGPIKSVAPTSTTTYTVTVTASNGCTSSDQVVVTVNAAPSANAGADATICAGGSTTLTASGGTSYSWSNSLGAGASKTVSPTTTTTYTVTVTNAAGCTAADQVIVNVNSTPNASAGADVAICNGTSTFLGASASGGVTPYTYAWSNSLGSGTSPSVSPTSSTTYTVTVTGSNGCASTDQVNVTVNSVPIANAGADKTICTGASTNLTVSGSGAISPYSFSWSNGGILATTTVAPAATTIYTVTVTSANGCFSTDQVTVNIQSCTENCSNGADDDADGQSDCADTDCGPSANAGPDISICPGNTAYLSVGVTGGALPYTYSWSGGLGSGANKTVTPATTTTYTVTVTSASGCTSTDQITVVVNACSEDCTNGIDDDGDGLVDCADPSCSGITAPVLVNDNYTTCPGMTYSNRVTYNDGNLNNPQFSISSQPQHGTVTIDWTGKFIYVPNSFECTTDYFNYEVCNLSSGCCSQATVSITMGDNTLPQLTNVPADLTISCDDALPPAQIVTAFDECPGLYIDFDESSSQNYVGACGSYTITRTWTATDFCGNSTTDEQKITVLDQTKPEIFQVYTLENGAKLVAGYAQRVTHDWKYVKFPISFKSMPAVFASLSSNVDMVAASVQVRHVSTQGFEMRLREEEAQNSTHGFENVSWTAVEVGIAGGASAMEVATLANINDQVSNLNFQQSYAGAPLFLSSIFTNAQSDPATLRHTNLTGTGIELFAQEEQSADAETARLNESIAYWAMASNTTTLKDLDGNIFGEVGKINLTNAWSTVSLTRNYTKPVVIIGGLTNNDNQPVTIRARNLSTNKFEARLQEWNYQDGSHAAETVTWMVIEGSIPGNMEFYCNNKADMLQPNLNIFAVDNCDDLVAFAYHEDEAIESDGMIGSHTWTAVDDCGNTTLLSRTDTCKVAAVRVKAILFGAVSGNGGGNVMRDNLRSQDLVPLVEPYSAMPTLPYVNIEHPMVTICHHSGQADQQTMSIKASELQEHLAHGDVVGACMPLPPTLPTGAANAQYRSIADGLWNLPSTWAGGNIPPSGNDVSASISIEHDVVLPLGNLFLKSNAKLWVTNGSLSVLTGNIRLQEASLYADNAVINVPLGYLYAWTGNCLMDIKNSVLYVGDDFANESGKRMMDNVCVTVLNDMTCGFTGSIDSLENVTASIGGVFRIFNNAKVFVEDSKFKLYNGNFTNETGCLLSGTGITILVENGNVANSGTWSATIDKICISGSIGIPTNLLPPVEECANIANLFPSCILEDLLDSDEDDHNGGTGGSSNSGGGNGSNGGNNNNSNVDQAVAVSTGFIQPTLLQTTGNQAVVDWLLVELRNVDNPADVQAYATVMLKRNGEIVTENGDSVIVFHAMPEEEYFVAIRHRNHLGLMTQYPEFLSIANPPLVDFSDPTTPIKGGLTAGKLNAGKRTFWGGDFNGDGRVIYQGPSNDVFYLFSKVLSQEDNISNLANYIVVGYEGQDFNMDGNVIYQGPFNDRAPLLYHSILAHSGNVSLLANYIVMDLIP